MLMVNTEYWGFESNVKNSITLVKNGINKFETDYNSEVIDEMYNTIMDTLEKNKYRYITGGSLSFIHRSDSDGVWLS